MLITSAAREAECENSAERSDVAVFRHPLHAVLCFGSCQMTQCLPDGLVVFSKYPKQVEPFSSEQKDASLLDGNVARCSSTPVLHDFFFFFMPSNSRRVL